MRFIIAPEFYEQMKEQEYHLPDCYVRPGEYLHHMYIDSVKYVVVPALEACLALAEERNDAEALRHLRLHKSHFDKLFAEASQAGDLEGVTLLGDPPPDIEEAVPKIANAYSPRPPSKWEDLGLPLPFLSDLILRTIYNRGQLTGGELAQDLRVPFGTISTVLQHMRKQTLVDIVGQRGSSGDASFVYEIKPPKGAAAVQDALSKSAYAGPAPVPFADYVEAVMAQSIKKLIVTRMSIQRAFEDLVITDAVFNEIGPAMNSGASIFFFGYPGNGKTSVAERITRLMGDIGRHLDFGRAGKKVRKQENDVVAKLDKMIEELEEEQKKKQPSPGPGGGSSPTKPKEESTPGGAQGPGKVENKNIGKKDGWGDLPPKEKQDVLQELSKDLPSHYREVIEQYFRKLARDRRGE